jgi:large subunit ribosomal protein L24
MKPLVYKKAARVKTQPKPTRMKLHVAKGDTIQVISGDDKGKTGTVLRVFPKSGRITVDGINLAKRHRRATENSEGGIMTFPAPIHHSKVMLIDPKSGEPTRVRRRKDADGMTERIAVKSGDVIARNR